MKEQENLNLWQIEKELKDLSKYCTDNSQYWTSRELLRIAEQVNISARELEPELD